MTHDDLALVFHRLPMLTYFGVGLYDAEKQRDEQTTQQEIQDGQSELLRALPICQEIADWLQAAISPTKRLNRRHTSYGYKHLAETILGDYVSNGTFIAAALYGGFPAGRVDHQSPNMFFGMAEMDVRGAWAIARDMQRPAVLKCATPPPVPNTPAFAAPQPADIPKQYYAPTQRQGLLSLRFTILKRDNYRCRLCGVAVKDSEDVRLEVDHITPKARGGTDDPSNLWTLCFACNRGKGIQTL